VFVKHTTNPKGGNRYGKKERQADAIDDLLKSTGARTAADTESLATELKKALTERMLNAEMDVHLDEAREREQGNHRSSSKTVMTEW
jgi:putative transposase